MMPEVMKTLGSNATTTNDTNDESVTTTTSVDNDNNAITTTTTTTTTGTTMTLDTTNSNQKQQQQQQQWLSLFYQKYATGKSLPDRNHTIHMTNALMSINNAKSDDKDDNNRHLSLGNDGSNNEQGQKNILHNPHQQRPVWNNVYGMGPILLSDIPESCRIPVNNNNNNTKYNHKVCIGIDEAGRGCVLGPMVYGAAFWNVSVYDNTISKLDGCLLADSKKLTDIKRYDIMDKIILPTLDIGFATRIIHSNEISRNMSRSDIPYNLNQMSHDAAIQLIHSIIQAGVTNIDTIYIDTVGTAETYQRKLEIEFSFHSPPITFIVESKADDKYPCCSAASIVAKVIRDRMLESWKYSESITSLFTNNMEENKDSNNNNNVSTLLLLPDYHYGSGYPSDPTCKQWMMNSIEPLFGYPDLVRFSWGPIKKIAGDNDLMIPVIFPCDLENNQDDNNDDDINNINKKHKKKNDGGMNVNVKKRQQEQMYQFLNPSSLKSRKKLPYFENMRLERVMKL